jgi:phospholipase C
MTRANGLPITHVFVVMLENRSFDNVFAMSRIPGIKVATAKDCNWYKDTRYCVSSNGPIRMPTDPAHEFLDVVEQLAGEGAVYPPGGPYPPINKAGFVANYATSTSEGPVPPAQDVGAVMACLPTASRLPVICQLAKEFAICDQWFSSLPGPTWPNRFFLHGASSSGLDDSPSEEDMAWWESLDGFKYPNGSLFDRLRSAGIAYRLYNDSTGFPDFQSLYSDDPQDGSLLGSVAQVCSLSGLSHWEVNYLSSFAEQLQGAYPYPYTFIEPHYGDLDGKTYKGGSSQHPMDDLYGGEHLLAAVYSAIRKSPHWNTSLLIITYDEHGGFYDCVAPEDAPAPEDNANYGYNKHGFDFKKYGVRVPAIVVSPLIQRGTVDHALYDHASVAKTVEKLFDLGPLTQRDEAANDLVHLLDATPRSDCPLSLDAPPVPVSSGEQLTSQQRSQTDAEPIPRSGNLVGALQVLRKTERELADGAGSAIQPPFGAIRTIGDARAYGASVLEQVEAKMRQHEHEG